MRTDDLTRSNDTPLTTREVARRRAVDAGQLRGFVRHHLSPEPAYVLEWAEADPEHRETVTAWLRRREHDRARRRAHRQLGGEQQ